MVDEEVEKEEMGTNDGNVEEVKKDFRKWFLDKTGNTWEDMDKFTQMPGKYTLVMEDDSKGMMMMR